MIQEARRGDWSGRAVILVERRGYQCGKAVIPEVERLIGAGDDLESDAGWRR